MQTDKVTGNNIFTDTSKISKTNAYDVKNQFSSLLKASCFEIETKSKDDLLLGRSNNSFSSFKREERNASLVRDKSPSLERRPEKKARQDKENNVEQKDTSSKEEVKSYEKDIDKTDKSEVNTFNGKNEDRAVTVESDKKSSDKVKEEVVEEMAIFAFAPVITNEKLDGKELRVDLTTAFSLEEGKKLDIGGIVQDGKEVLSGLDGELPAFGFDKGGSSNIVSDQTSEDSLVLEGSDSDAENFTYLFKDLVNGNKSNEGNGVNFGFVSEKRSGIEKLAGEEIQVLGDLEYSFEGKVKGEDAKNVILNDISKVKSQIEQLSKFIDGGESISISTGKENEKQKNQGSLSSLSMPLIAENAEGNTEVILNQSQVVTGVLDTHLKDAEGNLSKEDEGGFIFDSKSSTQGFGFAEVKVSIDNEASLKGDSSKVGGIDFSVINRARFTEVEENTSVKEVGGKIEIKAEEIADQIKVKFAGLKQGEDKFLVKLKPRELGDIEIELKVTKDGKVSATINSNKQETNQILQREVQTLQKMFTDNGYKADVSSFSFNFRGSNSNGGENNHQNDNSNHANNIQTDNNENFAYEDNQESYQRRGILA